MPTPSDTFASIVPNDEQRLAMENIRTGYSELEAWVKTHCPEGRLRSLALTALEESSMWAIKAISRGSG